MSEKDYRKLKIRLEDIQRRKKGKLPLLLGLLSSIFFFLMILMVFTETLLHAVAWKGIGQGRKRLLHKDGSGNCEMPF